ncbi:bacteriophage N4 adsorption protein B [compost metagenome]
MLARACERVGWTDLAWFLFDRVESAAQDAATLGLAAQGKAALERPSGTLDALVMTHGVVSPAQFARARSEAREGETGLSWLIRQDAIPFDRVVEFALGGKTLPAARPSRDRLGMRLLAERRISQGDLKQALSRQAHHPRPLGTILVEDFGLPAPHLQEALKAQAPLAPQWGPADAPAALLIRWGALRREHWEVAKGHGAKAFEVLVGNGQVLPSNVRRADTFRKLKLRLLAEGRFRLGEILVAQGVIERDILAKALAWQVDQPYRLGELLIRHRLASAEQVIEGLREQASRYDEAAEAPLPPIEQPPPPKPEILEEPPSRPRRKLWLWALAGATLIGALVFATRYTRGDFAWLSAFIQDPEGIESRERGVAQLLGGTQASGPKRERGTAFDPLDLPGSELSGQALSGSLGEGMVGQRLDEGFVGNRGAEGFVGAPLALPRSEDGLSDSSGLDAVGVPSGEKPVGTSGVTDSVAYGRQTSTGPRRGETTREAELRTLDRVQYPMQEERTMPSAPSPGEGGRMQERAHPENGLQAPIALNRTVDGSPPESIQVRRDTAVFRLRLGRSLFERKDTASAREEFLSAIALDPTLSPPHYYLGRIAEDRGDRDLAAKWYRSYLARSSGGEHSDEVRDRLNGLPN